MTATLFGETVPVGTGAAKVAATAVLADMDFFAPLFCADLRIPGFFAFGIFRFSFRHRQVTPDLRDYSPVNFCPSGVFTQSAESRSIHFQKYVQELNSFWCLCRRPVRCHGNPPMWRNGRRNGLKIRWAFKGPCRFESGHRHKINHLSARSNYRCKAKPNGCFLFQ